MEHLKDLYIAINQRLNDIIQNKNVDRGEQLLDQPLTILRLDIEQLIQLIASEKNINYDQITPQESFTDANFQQAADDICETLWAPKDGDE